MDIMRKEMPLDYSPDLLEGLKSLGWERKDDFLFSRGGFHLEYQEWIYKDEKGDNGDIVALIIFKVVKTKESPDHIGEVIYTGLTEVEKEFLGL